MDSHQRCPSTRADAESASGALLAPPESVNLAGAPEAVSTSLPVGNMLLSGAHEGETGTQDEQQMRQALPPSSSSASDPGAMGVDSMVRHALLARCVRVGAPELARSLGFNDAVRRELSGPLPCSLADYTTAGIATSATGAASLASVAGGLSGLVALGQEDVPSMSFGACCGGLSEPPHVRLPPFVPRTDPDALAVLEKVADHLFCPRSRSPSPPQPRDVNEYDR